MVILIDGKETQTSSTTSSYTNMNYVSKGISGVKGKTVTIKSKSNAPLKILAIIAAHNKKSETGKPYNSNGKLLIKIKIKATI